MTFRDEFLNSLTPISKKQNQNHNAEYACYNGGFAEPQGRVNCF